MNEEEKQEMELNIEAKYVGRAEKEFLNIITYAECLYILNTKNNYCDDIKDLSLLKIVDIVSKLQKEIEELEFKLLARERGEAELETLIDQLKEEIDKKDKIINLMTKEIATPGISIEMMNLYYNVSPDKPIWNLIKEYFYKKAEEENE